MTWVTGMALLSSVGLDAVSSAAAIRASVVRCGPLVDFEQADLAEMRTVPATGHRITGYTEGFVLHGCWWRLFEGCLEGMEATGQCAPASDAGYWRRTGVVVVTTELSCARFGLPKDVRFVWEWVERRFGGAVVEVDVVAEGRIGVARALGTADAWLESRRCDRVIVVAVDSYLDPVTLEWLTEEGRLAGPDNADGLRPGEAGAALVLEREPMAGGSGVRIASVELAKDAPLDPTRAVRARHAARAVQRCLNAVQGGYSGEWDLYTDENGESWRAASVSDVAMRLLKNKQDGCVLHEPALSIGDVGAASSVVQLVLAAQAHLRGYAAGPFSVALCTDEAGRSSAIAIEASSGEAERNGSCTVTRDT